MQARKRDDIDKKKKGDKLQDEVETQTSSSIAFNIADCTSQKLNDRLRLQFIYTRRGFYISRKLHTQTFSLTVCQVMTDRKTISPIDSTGTLQCFEPSDA